MNERSKRWERRFEVPVLGVALLVISVIVVEQSSFGEPCSRGLIVQTIANLATL